MERPLLAKPSVGNSPINRRDVKSRSGLMAPPGKDALLIIKACDRGEPGFAASRERTGRHGVESFGVMDSAIFAAETSPGDADGNGLAQNGRRGDTERAGPQVSAYPAGMSPR
jgi:hypothetical protein